MEYREPLPESYEFSQRSPVRLRERKLQALRAWWPQLTDEDWIRIAGQTEKLRGVIQEKYGYSRELAQQDLAHCFHALRRIF